METIELPQALVPAHVDCSDVDGFLLNVEHLMASELVALSSHEVIGAALLLWCRAWKQRPAASLPDDDNVLAAFCKMKLSRFRKLRNELLRGFVRCSDGRLYHRLLAAEAIASYEKKRKVQRIRDAENGRLRKWRSAKRQQNQAETTAQQASETHDETRFIAVAETRFMSDVAARDKSRSGKNGRGSAARARVALSVADLQADGLSEEVAAEFLAMRSRMRAPLTPLAWQGIKAEATKAGWSAEQAVRKCLARGWRGFEAAWVNGRADEGPQARLERRNRAAVDAFVAAGADDAAA